MPNVLTRSLIQAGPVWSVLFFTIPSIGLSLALTLWLERDAPDLRDRLAISALIPLIVAPIVSAFGVKMIFQLEKIRAELNELAIRDPLTKLYNRQYFMERLRAAIEFSKRNRDPLALIMIDIDYFKLINDNYGHNCGDFILVEFSKLCLSIFRNYDVVSRYGGEEFFIILPGTSNTVACDIAERLRIAVEKREFEFGPENPLNITVSLGVTSVDEGGDLRSMIALADEALYISKNAGRNQSSYKILS